MIDFIRFRPWLAGIAMLLSAAIPDEGMARTLAGVTMPDTMTVQGTLLQLNGMGLRTFTVLRIQGYVAGLYVAEPAHRAQAIMDGPGIKLLRIQFVRSASIGRIQDELRQGRRKICADGCPQANDAAFAQLLDTVRPVKPGDTTTYVFGPLGLQVLFNEKSLATIQNVDFSRRLLGGMVGSHPPSEVLRDGLLGGPTG